MEATTNTIMGTTSNNTKMYIFAGISVMGLILMSLSSSIILNNHNKINMYDDESILLSNDFESIAQTFFVIAVIACVDVLYDIKEVARDILKTNLWHIRLCLSLVYLATALFYFYFLNSSLLLFRSSDFAFHVVSTSSNLITSNAYILIILMISPSNSIQFAASVALAITQTLYSTVSIQQFSSPSSPSSIDYISHHHSLSQQVLTNLNCVALLVYIAIYVFNAIGPGSSSNGKRGSVVLYLLSLVLQFLAPFQQAAIQFFFDSSCNSSSTQALWSVYAACASTVLLLVATRVDHMVDVESKVCCYLV